MRQGQTVGVVLTLVGRQHTAVAAQQPRTECAAVAVRIGRALLYLHDPETVSKLGKLWSGLSEEAAAQLPRGVVGPLAAEVRGMREPGVVVDAAHEPPAWGRLEREPGSHARLRVQIGRLVFDIRDREAFATTDVAFRQAELVARTAFDGVSEIRAALREKAFEDARRAFPPPRLGTRFRDRYPSEARPPWAQPRRPRLSKEWMQ
jgi:hypothetical protein